MASDLQRDWDLSVNAVELESGPVYFCSDKVLSDQTTRHAVKLHREEFIDTFRREFPTSVKFAFTAYNPGDVSQSEVKNAVDYRRLEEDLDARKPLGSKVVRSFGFFPDDSSHFERGVSLIVPAALESVENARTFVNSMCGEYGQAGYFEYSVRDGGVWQDLVCVPSQKIENSSLLVRVDPPPCHPVFAHPNYHAVFQSVTKLQQVLSQMKDLQFDGIEELLTVASQKSIPLECGTPISPPKAVNPVIVIEGLDATGKSTVCKRLTKALNATLHSHPPSCLRNQYPKFARPHLARRTFYALGNYIIAQEIAAASESGPVVVDRFWHSSAAYAIATEVGCGDASTIPPEGHDIYKWPQDLLKPDIVILLVVSPEERSQRMLARGEGLTEEETELDKSRNFQERVLECYRQMFNPCLSVVDASGSRDDVYDKVGACIKQQLPQVNINY